MGLLDRVAQRPIGVDFVKVSATDAGSLHITLPHKISNDRLSSALGNSDPVGDISAADTGVTCDTDQDMAMVGEERPARPRHLFRRVIGVSHALNGSRVRDIVDGFEC